MTGMIFDIKELAVFDGPGIRTTIFLKGCPLECVWCHNPEGISHERQLMVSRNSCISCGACTSICDTQADPEHCRACGLCISTCPLHLRKISGELWEASNLAKELLRHRKILEANGGGITFSGGEPLMQHRFLLEVIELLEGMHCAIETSGYASPEVFREVVSAVDYVLVDLKMMDPELHERYCGKTNAPILENISQVKKSDIPFTVRIPVIPGVNDTDENFRKTAEFLEGSPTLEKVELLPYQKTAGAKFGMLGKNYNPPFDVDLIPHLNTEVFIECGIACSVL